MVRGLLVVGVGQACGGQGIMRNAGTDGTCPGFSGLVSCSEKLVNVPRFPPGSLKQRWASPPFLHNFHPYPDPPGFPYILFARNHNLWHYPAGENSKSRRLHRFVLTRFILARKPRWVAALRYQKLRKTPQGPCALLLLLFREYNAPSWEGLEPAHGHR